MRGKFQIASAILLLLSPPAFAAPRDNAPGPAAAATVRLVDLDRDNISDDLQAKLGRIGASERVDVVVQFAVPDPAAAAQALVGGFALKRQFTIIDGFAASLTAGQVRALARAPSVLRIEEDFTVTTQLDGANADFGAAKARIDFVKAGAGISGAGIGVCIVDTGIDPNHEQLAGAGKVTAFANCLDGCSLGENVTPFDDHGHGTHVASIAAGQKAPMNGVAPGAWLFGAKVLDLNGSGSESGVIAGIEWCAGQAGAHVISMSLGTAGGSDGKDALSTAVNNAVTLKGKVVVVAAGNSGPGQQTVGSPGAAEQAITVGAAANWSGDGGGVYLAAFSSRGTTLDNRLKPDIAAPGVRINAAMSGTAAGYVIHSGTSMAAPFVSGAVALALHADPALTPTKIKELVKATAQDRGPAGADNEWGAGLLDVYHLVDRAAGCTGTDCQATPMPTATRLTDNVPSGGTWLSGSFAATAGIPVAATVTILSGGPSCLWGDAVLCDLLGGWEWLPDLDAYLVDGSGIQVRAAAGDVTVSECMLQGEACGDIKGAGRQETLHFKVPADGTYKIEVFAFDGAGSFAVDLSHGPLAGGAPPPPPLPPPSTMHIGDLDGQKLLNRTNWRARVTVTVHNNAEAVVSGTAVSGTWTWSGGASAAACTTGTAGTCTMTTARMANTVARATFAVSNVRKSGSGLSYASGDNHNPDGDGNDGTTITITK